MSNKNFMAFGDAETIFTGYANEINDRVHNARFKDGVGHDGINILPHPYRINAVKLYGVWVIANEDGSVTLDGTYSNSSYANFTLFNNGSNPEIVQRFVGRRLIASLDTEDEGLDGKVLFQIYNYAGGGSQVAPSPNHESLLTWSNDGSADWAINIQIPAVANGFTFNNVTVFPCIRDAKVKKTLGVPALYYPSSDEETRRVVDAAFGVLDNGNVGNLFDYRNYPSDEETLFGVTLTNNHDGSFTLNGTPTQDMAMNLRFGRFADHAADSIAKDKFLPNIAYDKYYILSGNPGVDLSVEGANYDDVRLYVTYRNAADTAWEHDDRDYGDGVVFKIPNGRYYGFYIWMRAGITLDNYTIKPNVVPLGVSNPKVWREPHYSNDVLTQKYNDLQKLVTRDESHQLLRLHTGTAKGITYEYAYNEEAQKWGIHVTGTLSEQSTSQYVVDSYYLQTTPEEATNPNIKEDQLHVSDIRPGEYYILSDGDNPNKDAPYIISWQWTYDEEEHKWKNTHNFATRGKVGKERDTEIYVWPDTQRIDFVLEVVAAYGWQQQLDEWYYPMLRRKEDHDREPSEFIPSSAMLDVFKLSCAPTDRRYAPYNDNPDNLPAGFAYGNFNGLGWGYMLTFSSDFIHQRSPYMGQLFIGGNIPSLRFRSRTNRTWGSWYTVTATT